MNDIMKPFGIVIISAMLIGLFNFTNYAETANLIGMCAALLFFTLFIHELGHVVFGIWSGYKFNYVTVGPITIEKTDRLRISVNDSWFSFGGVSNCTPLAKDLETIARQHKWYAAGGPIFSVVVGMISLLTGEFMNIDMVYYFGIFNLSVFVLTILPYQGSLKSDGRILWELWRGGKHSDEFLISLLLIKEMMTPLHPRDWSKDLIRQAKTLEPTIDNISVAHILFYYTLVTKNYDTASNLIEPFKQIPITKKNKFTLQFINQIKQIDMVVNKEEDKEQFDRLHRLMNSFEPISYKRSEAIRAKLNGDNEQVRIQLSEVMKEIEKGKGQFGFYYAEEQLSIVLTSAMQPELEQMM